MSKIDWSKDSRGEDYSWKAATLPCGFQCGSCYWSYPVMTYLNPHDADKVRLEVLLDGLEMLAFVKGRFSSVRVNCIDNSLTGEHKSYSVGAFDPVNFEEESIIEGYLDRRTAIIAAIELLEVKSGT